MHQYPKNIKRFLREYATEAYERELHRELTNLDHRFAEWRNGTISSGELRDRIHQYETGPSRVREKVVLLGDRGGDDSDDHGGWDPMTATHQRSLDAVVGPDTYSVWVNMLRALVPQGRTHRLAPLVAGMLQYRPKKKSKASSPTTTRWIQRNFP